MGGLSGIIETGMSTLFLLSLALVILPVSGGAESRLSSDHGQHNGIHVSRDSQDLKTSWAFKVEDMKAGARKALYIPTKEEALENRFIPREIADRLPFSRKELPRIMALFGIAPGSQKAAYVESALEACEKPPASEVFKACFTSFDSMLEAMFGVFNVSDEPLSTRRRHDGPRVMSSVFRGPHRASFQNYTVLEDPREVPTTRMAGCHAAAYPYKVFYCHVQPGETKVFQISLLGELDGVRLDAVAPCHLDTSQWDPDNWAFLTLGLKRGDPVCHFLLPEHNFAWVRTPPLPPPATQASL